MIIDGKTVCVLALATMGFQAHAQQSSLSHVDVFYIANADLEISESGLSAKDDGDGFGFKGRFQVADQFFIAAEYQAVEYDDSRLELDQLRAGLGWASAINPMLNFVGQAEYIRAELDAPGAGSDNENGFGIHAGLEAALAPQFTVHGSIGFVSIGDGDGPEFLVGLASR